MSGFHTFPIERAEALDDPGRYRYCSREELLTLLGGGDLCLGTVADLGSGIGFFTDDVAPFAETCYAVDVQAAMHDQYRARGLPDAVSCVTAEVADLPFPEDHLDAAFSTMTHHEYADPAVRDIAEGDQGTLEAFTDPALEELARVLRPDGRLAIVDWSADGEGESGPPTDERLGLADVTRGLEAVGFEIVVAANRPETLAVAAVRSADP